MAQNATQPATAAPVVIDLGKQKKGRIKQLRKGQGPLVDVVLSTVQTLKDSGKVTANDPVVVILRPKKDANKLPWAPR